ncbi:MAG: IS110 family transposase [Gammaproteobacteria bacterium]|nr:IS110 family transposase [Gammaproteobacteria bacterium]
MKKETSEGPESISAGDSAQIKPYAGYVGLDVHKDSIAVAVAYAGREAPESWGTIPNTKKAVAKLVDRLYLEKKTFLLCYEAGPCGYAPYQNLSAMGMDCRVVAPPRNEKIKTDRRDALRLARLLRAGELVEVWVPDQEQEAVRDLCRCRADFKAQQQKLRQQLNAFVLRHGHHWPTKRKRWTQKHMEWLETLDFPYDYQSEVRDEYIAAVRLSSSRMTDLDQKIKQALRNWSWAPLANSLVALRGFDQLSAVTLLSELGDVSRFGSPNQLMGYLGLVPCVYSSGAHRRTGGVTQAGNRHARQVLVESAWCYRFPARQTAYMNRKAEGASAYAQATAWKAQKRLCGRYRKLIAAGKNQKVVCVAIARELTGFVWDIVCHEKTRISRVAHGT